MTNELMPNDENEMATTQTRRGFRISSFVIRSSFGIRD
jgi:hypothetical protein